MCATTLAWRTRCSRSPTCREAGRFREAGDAHRTAECHEGIWQRARRPGELSGGEQQRAAIARALVNEPSIILADEPTGSLDSQTGDSILALLSGLNREHGVSIVMVTHRSDAERWSDRTIELRDGRIAGDAPAASRARLAG